jgi:hypothetical protein
MFSCKPNTQPENLSNQKALESNDWFKGGVDRFYLAYLSEGEKIHPGFLQRYGEQFFFGIGCYGEIADSKALLSVPVAPGSKTLKKIAINKRTMLHEFPLYFGEGRPPKKGQCKILLGSEDDPQKITNPEELLNGGQGWGVANNFFAAGLSCLGLAIAGTKLVATAVAGGYATVQTGGLAAPAVVPPLLADGAAVATSGYFCSVNANKSVGGIKKYQMAENQKVFGNALKQASEIARNKMRANGLKETYDNLRRSHNPLKISVAAAIWNKILVESFNEDVKGKFENGWGNETKFFDAVESIQTEIMSNSTL